MSSIDLYREGKFQEASQGFVSALKDFRKSVSSDSRYEIDLSKHCIMQRLRAWRLSMMMTPKIIYDSSQRSLLKVTFEVQVPKKVIKKYNKERKRLLRKKRGAVLIEDPLLLAQKSGSMAKRSVSLLVKLKISQGDYTIYGLRKRALVKRVA